MMADGLPTLEADGLAERARKLRFSVLRTHALAGQGHLGSSLSVIEILTAIFASGLDTRGWTRPDPRGDRLVLSKGHAGLALYCALAQAGFIPPEQLRSFARNGSALEPHPNERTLPAVQVSTGSLGQGLSIGLGLAYGSRLDGHDETSFVVLGDGELNEGQPWEAAMAAVRFGLGNLLAIVDRNGFQQDGAMDAIMPLPDIAATWSAFGWAVSEVDGHDCDALINAIAWARGGAPDRPKMIVAHTVKGRGVPFLESTTESHYPPPLDASEIELLMRLARKPRGHHG
jgi:transketolase